MCVTRIYQFPVAVVQSILKIFNRAKGEDGGIAVCFAAIGAEMQTVVTDNEDAFVKKRNRPVSSCKLQTHRADKGAFLPPGALFRCAIQAAHGIRPARGVGTMVKILEPETQRAARVGPMGKAGRVRVAGGTNRPGHAAGTSAVFRAVRTPGALASSTSGVVRQVYFASVIIKNRVSVHMERLDRRCCAEGFGARPGPVKIAVRRRRGHGCPGAFQTMKHPWGVESVTVP